MKSILFYLKNPKVLEKRAFDGYVHPKDTFVGFCDCGFLAIFAKIGQNFCVCRLGAHTVMPFSPRRAMTLHYMHAKYYWLTPNSLGDIPFHKYALTGTSRI